MPQQLPRIQVSVTLTQEQKERLDEISESQDLSIQQVIKAALGTYDQTITGQTETPFTREL